MTPRQHQWFRAINAALLGSCGLAFIFFCIKGPLLDARERELRAEQLELRSPDWLKKKLLLAQELILAQESVERYFHGFALVMTGVVATASAANLLLARKGAPK